LPDFYAIVLAAGKGTRMQGEPVPPGAPKEFPKVLRPVLGRPMIYYALDALSGAGIDDITIVIGYGGEEVRRVLGPRFRYAVQSEQLGSGHAVASARELLRKHPGDAIITCGDSPLFTAESIQRLKEIHSESGAVITLASALIDDPTGYGRIIRDESGSIKGITEEKAASQLEKSVREINGGAYAFRGNWLWQNLDRIKKNEQGEYYLTDLVGMAIEDGLRVESVSCAPEETYGVNTPEQLKEAESVLQDHSAR
jgi:bifunctional UDP-N-acetylglucosamine pyrophosphorylase / glucosamine-1-phosphate N-acetyltransferase